MKGWHWLSLACVVGALVLLGPHVWKFYINPRDTLQETAAACRNEGEQLFGLEVARIEAGAGSGYPGFRSENIRRQRDSYVEDCIKKQGWCVYVEGIGSWPNVTATFFLPHDRLAAWLYDLRYLDYHAYCP